MGRRLEKRPNEQISPSNPHSSTTGMARTEESIGTQCEKKYHNSPLQNIQGEKMLDEAQGKNCQRNGGGMSESDRDECANDRRAALLLQTEGQRKQPAHGGIQPVVGPEECQRNPGPRMSHG